MNSLQIGAGLITPGLEPALLAKAAASRAVAVHIELEDGVPIDRKIEARQNIVSALRELEWADKLTLVRVNPVDSGELEEDILEIGPARPTAILLAKCQGPEDITYADRLLCWVERKNSMQQGSVKLAAMIERARAFETVEAVARASDRMMALYIGPSDLGNELGYRRTYRGLEMETWWPRARVALAAHGAGLLAIDSPYVPFHDLDGTLEQSRFSYRLGFDIKTCISPRQIDTVHKAFTPTPEEIRWAQDVLEGQREAVADKRSVWVAHDMMLDAPHVEIANSILARANPDSD